MNDIKKPVRKTYRIGDINIEVRTKPYNKFIRQMSDYESEGNPDFVFEINDEDINRERKGFGDGMVYNGVVCQLAFLRKLSEELPANNSFLLHSACFDIDGVGVAFSARSGTGKSTHLANWYAYINGKENMPESLKVLRSKNSELRIADKDNKPPKLTIVNGDKPIVRFFDEDFCKEKSLEIPDGTEFGIPYAYGTPWRGKENLGGNTRTPIKHICFIERSENNFVTRIEKGEAVERIMKQVFIPNDPIMLANTLKLVNRLINCCELWIIHCNMEPESAKVAYDAIFR